VVWSLPVTMTADREPEDPYDSPEPTVVHDQHQLKKKTRTPFGRAQTVFTNPPHAGTPMDLETASPPCSLDTQRLTTQQPCLRGSSSHCCWSGQR
jgi:hypothetical protein